MGSRNIMGQKFAIGTLTRKLVELEDILFKKNYAVVSCVTSV